MGTCDYCGSQFPRTRATRKYCSPRCKTNACLDRNPSRMPAAGVRELYGILDEDFQSVDELRERLRQIVAPDRPPISVRTATVIPEEETVYIPSLD